MKNTYLYSLVFLSFTFILNAQSPLDSISTGSTPIDIDDSSSSPLQEDEKTIFTWNKGELGTEKIEIANSPGIDVTRLMQSKTAGLNIFANSFTPAASSRMTFRGYRSFNNSNEPLILLNGIPFNNNELGNGTAGTDQSNRLIDIDPHFIEDIEFISNASSRARYGIAGSNGIISIRTKNDYNQKLKVGFSSSITSSQVSQLPLLQNTRAQGRITGGTANYLGPETGNAFSWGPLVSELYYDETIENLYDNNGAITFNNTGTPINTYDPYVFFTNAWTQNYSLSLSKATKLYSTNVVGSYANESGVIPTNKYARYNLGVGFDIRPIKNLTLSVNGAVIGSVANRTIKGSSINGIMLGLLRTSPTFDNTNGLEDPVNNPSSYLLDDERQRSYRAGVNDNPYRSINETSNINEVYRYSLQAGGKYDLSEKWSILFNSGIDYYNDFREGGINEDPSSLAPRNASLYSNTYEYESSHLQISSVYNPISSNTMNLDLTVGYEYNQSSLLSDFLSASNIILGEPTPFVASSSFNDFKRAGGIFAIDFDFMERLNINASIRQDYSNQFGPETNGFTSWGIGGEFNFIQLMDTISRPYFNMGLISSVGRMGNINNSGIKNGVYTPGIIGGDGFISSFPVEGFEPNDYANSQSLTAENTLTFDIGIVTNFRNIISSRIIYYNEQSNGLHAIQPISSSSGLNFQYLNVGSISNSGFDVSLSINPIRKRVLNWSFDIHFNKNVNVVNNINDIDKSQSMGPFTTSYSVIQEGLPYGAIIGTGFEKNENGETLIGDDGWPLTDSNLFLGDPNPDWMMFVGNSITLFESLTLSALIEIKQGGDMYCGTCGTLDYFGRTQRAISEINGTFVFDGVDEFGAINTQAVELAPTSGSYTDFYRVRYGFGGLTEMSIYDASWIKLRNLSLTYDFSNLLNLKLGRSVSLGFTMENFILRTTYPGIDPETNLTGNSGAIGFDYYNNPGIERYGFHLKLNF